VRAYRACVTAGQCRAETTVQWRGISEDDVRLWSRECNWSKPDGDEHPMNCVDWRNADAFCRWRGARLPTEAEWEYAARGGDGRVYPWGSDAPGPTRLNAAGGESRRYMESIGRTGWAVMYEGDDGWPTTAPVGSYPRGASPFGALDMAGNVWEWVCDGNGSPPGEVNNPIASADGPLRRVRGGGWDYGNPSWRHAASRDVDTPPRRSSIIGFRCARGSR
jgi:formylglycine-generating enzyme required for sulfatase activity